MKRCSGCKEFKSAEQFHKNRATSDGLSNYCKPCMCISRRSRYWNKTKAIELQNQRNRMKNPEEQQKMRDIQRKAQKKYRLKNSLKIHARAAVFIARRSNKLTPKSTCELCRKEEETHAHHWHGYDIDKWLDVIWLCFDCHKMAEQKKPH